MKRPFDRSAIVEAAMAIVGAVRTNTLLMLMPKPYARGSHRAGCQNRELVAAMPLGDPGRLISESLGENDKFNHLRRVWATRDGDADLAHALPLVCRARAARSGGGCQCWPSVGPGHRARLRGLTLQAGTISFVTSKLYTRAVLPPTILACSSSGTPARISARIFCDWGNVDSLCG